MLRRRRPDVPPWRAPFLRVVDAVDRAGRALVSAAPRGRPSPVPLAEALAGFESALAEAAEDVAELPAIASEHATAWAACAEGIAEAQRRAERLRLEANPEGYEALIREFDRLLEPLDAVARTAQELGIAR